MPGGQQIEPPPELLDMPVLFGGPVEQGRGFVLHTSDYFTADSSLPVAQNVALTATVGHSESHGAGRRSAARGAGAGLCRMGAGVSSENEIQHNGWLTCPADEDLLVRLDYDERYSAALRKLKIDPAMLSSDAGHA